MTRDTQGFPYRKAPFVWAHGKSFFAQLIHTASIHVVAADAITALCGEHLAYYRTWRHQGTMNASWLCPDCVAVVHETLEVSA